MPPPNLLTIMNVICLDCGNDYNYDPSNPLGASSNRCCKCRKRDSEKNKKLILLEIAGHGQIRCCKCGYNNVAALALMDAVFPLGGKAESFDERKRAAKDQYIICHNCREEIKAGEIEVKVKGLNPVSVEFYAKVITVTKVMVGSNEKSDALDCEITTDEPQTDRIPRAEKEIKRIAPLHMPDL